MSLLRTLVPLIAGALGGGAAAYFALAGSGAAATAGTDSSLLDTVVGFAARRETAAERVPATASGRLAAYRAAAALQSAADLELALERAAAAAPSAARTLEIDALLEQLCDRDAARGAGLARTFRLEPAHVAGAFRCLSEVDADAALADLGRIDDGAARRAAALAMLAVVGDDAQGIERIAAALPGTDSLSFRVDAYALRAEHDAEGALRDLTTQDDVNLLRRAQARLGAAWARSDPHAALAYATELPFDVQASYRNAVAREWARVDADGFLVQLAATPNIQQLAGGISWLIGGDAERLLAAAERLPGTLGNSVRMSAYSSLAATDPAAMAARAEALPPSADRTQLLQLVATSYGRENPDAALAWANRLTPRDPNVLRAAIQGIAATDVERAFDLAATAASTGAESDTLLRSIASQAAQNPDQAAKAADRLLARNDPAGTTALSQLMGTWVQRDTDAALGWLVAQGSAVSANAVGNAAQRLADRDPVAAAGYVERLPTQLRGAWVTQVAGPYARANPDAAFAWLSRYQGQPEYDTALTQALQQAAQNNFDAAARMFAQASPNVQLSAAGTIANVSAQRDPAAAAQWAIGLADPRAQAQAVQSVAAAWSARDAPGAQRWVLTLPSGTPRDQALQAVIARSANSGTFDTRLLDAMSTPAARDEGVQRAFTVLLRRDRVQAQALLARVSDPTLRQRLTQQLANAATTTAPPPADVIITR